MSDSRLVDLSDAILAQLVARWGAFEATPAWPHWKALPDRRLITMATPTADCEQLTVAPQRAFGTAGDSQERIMPASTGTPWLRVATISVQILRCHPTQTDQGAPPAAAAVTAVTQTILSDADLIQRVLIDAQKAGELAGCNGLAFGGWTPSPEQGGFAGGTTAMRLNLF